MQLLNLYCIKGNIHFKHCFINLVVYWEEIPYNLHI